MLRILFILALNFFVLSQLQAQDTVAQSDSEVDPTETVVSEIVVEGNGRVETEAILTIIGTQKGEFFDSDQIAEDIHVLFDLKYFSDIRVYREKKPDGIKLIYSVKEKPAITEIVYEGFEEVTEDEFSEKLDTKIYTIVNESTIKSDLTIIEKSYAEKGFFLADVSYELENIGENEVKLIYRVNEGGVVRFSDVYINGNEYFTDQQLVALMYSKPLSRTSRLQQPGSLYQELFVSRDADFLAYHYRDHGFADVKVAKPLKFIDKDRRYVQAAFEIEEGLQYYVGKISFSGDKLFEDEKLLEEMQLKPGELFRHSRFRADIEYLTDKYGDLGYAFAYVNPKTQQNKTASPPTVDITYDVSKGEKVYFGKFEIVGNTKTRKNVILREFEVHDGELYSGTGLRDSKRNLERLGFFEEIQAIRSRDEEDKTLLNYKIRVKEKPTGQLQAALGYQPGQSRSEQQWFGQGSYKEENQSGRGWRTGLTGKWNRGNNYSLGINFTNPRLNDSHWSLGTSLSLDNSVSPLTDDIDVEERRVTASVTLGRRIIELIRGFSTYSFSRITTSTDRFIIESLKTQGIQSKLTLGLSRNSTNNYLDPSDGSIAKLSHSFIGGPLQGDFQFQESRLLGEYYFPIDFTETYRTYFHFKTEFGYLQPFGDVEIPIMERYRLGGFNDLRGYNNNSIGPFFNILSNPQGRTTRFNKGGNREVYAQLEYFLPIIPEVNLKGLVFADAGRVYDDEEPLSLLGVKRDFGFGFRWITPVAPFRFEWAYPYENGEVGKQKFIFYLGY